LASLPWLDRGEVFTIYTDILATLAPLEIRRGVDGTPRVGFRPIVGVMRKDTLFAFQSQDLIRLVSDRFVTGADLFATADHPIDQVRLLRSPAASGASDRPFGSLKIVVSPVRFRHPSS
jgi:hypothetical protein